MSCCSLEIGNQSSYCDTRLGGTERWYIGEPEDAYMRIPDVIKDCAAFLAVKIRENNQDVMYFGGTGFFVSVPSEHMPGTAYMYFVTARHNVEKAEPYGGLFIRLNTQVGGGRFFGINVPWEYPDDETSDIAVIPWAPPQDTFDYASIPSTMFATESVLKAESIGIGDDLIIVGLFTQRQGTHRNLPIVRTGIIASMPDEPLQDTNTGEAYDAYLAEVRSIGGLSGSPVFVFLEPGRIIQGKQTSQRKIFLLGIIRGHWDYKHTTGVVDFADDELHYVNMGIAIVTPVQAIYCRFYTEMN